MWVAGSNARSKSLRDAWPRGVTLLELLLVVAIIAIAVGGASLALRDASATQLEREGVRLAALLDAARARARASGAAVFWHATPRGFRFEGLPPGTLPEAWLNDSTTARAPATLVLGPEPIIGPQRVQIHPRDAPQKMLTIATDGIGPFAVQGAMP